MTRVRFAPSPTGKLHVGNVRTALANVLFARKEAKGKGVFVVRIEDTDLGREVERSEDIILSDMDWLGLTPDEDPRIGGDFAPYRTLERMERGDYQTAIDKLFSKGRAYECFVSKTELDLMRKIQTSQGQPPHYDNRHRELTDEEKEAYLAEGRKPVIRFKLNDASIEWKDMVRGDVHYEAKHLGGDPVIVRSNGIPLFTLAGVVDDINQKMTHIVRGEDHVTNTAAQVQIFEALGAKVPTMAHLPMLQDSDGGKLSKRLDSLSIEQLRNDGYLPKAITTYMASLGFSSLPDVGTVEELAKNFDFTKMGRSAVRFDTEQLEHVNASAIHGSSYEEVKLYLKAFLTSDKDETTLSSFWEATKANYKTLKDIQMMHDICLKSLEVSGNIESDEDKEFIKVALENLPSGEYSSETWKAWTSSLKEITGRKGKALFMPLRLAITGMSHGPEMSELIQIIGENEIRNRLEKNV